MILDGHGPLLAIDHARARSVVEVDVAHLHLLRQRVGLDREVVVLRGDLDAAGWAANRVVAAVVAEFELERLTAERLTEDLVAHADAKHGHLAEDRLGVLHGVGHRGGIAGAVAEEDPVGLHGHHLRRGHRRGNDGDAAAVGREAAHDVVLDAEIVRDHVQRTLRRRLGPRRKLPLTAGGILPLVGFGAGHLRDHVLAHDGPALGHGDQLIVRLGSVRGDDAVEASGVAEPEGDGSGVNLGDADHVLLLEVLRERHGGAVVGDVEGEVADEHAAHVRLGGLHVLEVDADVADLGAGEEDELPGVGGIGQDLLVPRERRVEDNLADGGALGAEGASGPHGAVLEDQAAVVSLPGLLGRHGFD